MEIRMSDASVEPKVSDKFSEQGTGDRLKQTIEELRSFEKKNLRINRIRMICSIASLSLLIIALILLSVNIGKVAKVIDEVSTIATETGNNINIVAQDLGKVDFEKLGKSIQGIADIGEDTLKQVNHAAGQLDNLIKGAETAMEHINSVNFEDLNNGIQRLNDVLEPLANFFNLLR